MSYWYRKEEAYGPYRHDWTERDGEVHEEEYSRKPVTSSKHAGDTHHRDCTYDMFNLDTCLCYELYERDSEQDKEVELEEMHAVWWQ